MSKTHKGMQTISVAYGMARGVLMDAKTSSVGSAYNNLAKIVSNDQAIIRLCHESSSVRAHAGCDYAARVHAHLQYMDEAFKNLTMVGYLAQEDENERIVRKQEYKNLARRKQTHV